RFDVLDLLRSPWSVEEHVVPMRRVEVFDRFELEAGSLHFTAQRGQLVGRPKPVGVAGQAPPEIGSSRLVVPRDVRATSEVVHQVSYDVRSACLARELKILAREHVAVETEAEFHCNHPTLLPLLT